MSLSPQRIAHCARHYAEPPQKTEKGARTWITRGVNIVVVVTEAVPGTVLVRDDNPDEYMVILCPGVVAQFAAGGETVTATGPSLTIVPPGASRITLPEGGRLARLFTSRATDLAEAAGNAETYDASPDTAVAPLADWPGPSEGFRLRSYPLDTFEDRDGPRIQPRIFRSSNMMINAFVPWRSRRDPREMSPHWHADFEQASLGLQGSFIHHIRYPWNSDSTQWEPDQHLATNSPSVAIIPPPSVHTTQDVGQGDAWLIDIFAPPRVDFGSKPGFVLNEADYPMPVGLVADPERTGGSLLSWQGAR